MENDPVMVRLHRIEGQVAGVCRMYESERSCLEIFDQLAAARAGLQAVGMLVLQRHVADRLAPPVGPMQAEIRQQEIVDAVQRFLRHH